MNTLYLPNFVNLKRKYSLLGIFVRRCILEMNKLMFDDISRLYNAFIEYRKIMVKHVVKSNIKDTHTPFEISEMTEFAHQFHMHKQGILHMYNC
jgi:hypothetical protein